LLNELFKRKNVAILVGGSGLYINAITQGFDALPKASQEVRDQLNRRFETEGLEVLQHQLSELDPDYFSSVDTQNPQRLIRALEVCLSTGKTFSELRTKSIKQRPFDIVKIGLNMDRQKLYDRINQRVDLMMDAGLLEEVRALLPYRDKNALRTVGYQELYDYLDGKCSLEQAVEKIKQNTRNFAKRQLTWFRRDTEITWFEPQQTSLIIQTIEQKMADNN
jgi:tRNA dimethylallyltransferase